jgi:hypothetical protein
LCIGKITPREEDRPLELIFQNCSILSISFQIGAREFFPFFYIPAIAQVSRLAQRFPGAPHPAPPSQHNSHEAATASILIDWPINKLLNITCAAPGTAPCGLVVIASQAKCDGSHRDTATQTAGGVHDGRL